MALLTQADIRNLIQSLQNPHYIHDAVKLLSYAVSIAYNVKVMFENGITELLAELLEDRSICQEDIDSIAVLIDKLVTTDVSGVDSTLDQPIVP